MNNLTKTLIFLSALALGGVIDHLCFKSVSIERTKSGMYILDSGSIYSLVELDRTKDGKETKTDSYNVIPSYGDSQSYRLPVGKK
tara:strand:- start:647 stop:901 length:255 start_codon:yes stop_codon:yes gene_type:complete